MSDGNGFLSDNADTIGRVLGTAGAVALDAEGDKIPALIDAAISESKLRFVMWGGALAVVLLVVNTAILVSRGVRA